MKNNILSVILYVDAKEAFSKTLSRFEDHLKSDKVKLIVVDPCTDVKIAAACEKYGEDRILYIRSEHAQMAEAYQKGLEHLRGSRQWGSGYVNFALTSSWFSDNVFDEIIRIFDQYRVPMVSAMPLYSDNGVKPYAGSFRSGTKERLVDLSKEFNTHKIQLVLQAYFFRVEAISAFSFNTKLQEDAAYDFLLRVQLDAPEYVYSETVSYFYTVPLEDDTSKNQFQYQPRWYQKSVADFMIPLLCSASERFGAVPGFLQTASYYLLYAKFNCNYDARDKGVLKNRQEVDEFVETVSQALAYIDNPVIMKWEITTYMLADRKIRVWLLREKAKALGGQVRVLNKGTAFLALLIPGEEQTEEDYREEVCYLGNSEHEKFWIRNLNYRDHMMHIDAETDLSDYFEPDRYEIYAERPGKKPKIYHPEYNEIYPLVKCFGITFMRKRRFQFHLPVEEKRKQEFRFYYRLDGKDHVFWIRFSSYTSRLISKEPKAYWMFREGWMLRTDTQAVELVMEPCGRLLHLKKEVRFCQTLLSKPEYKSICRKGIGLRILYWILMPSFNKKHIWVTFDKTYKAGDNGEYLFQYIRKNHREIDIYYIVREDSPDYRRLVKQHGKKHILKHGSLRCQLMCIGAELLLATHVNISAQYNPSPEYNIFTKDLQKGILVCIQHGLSIQKIAQYQNRLFDNTQLYCCASPYEVQNLSHPFYGYSKDVFRLVGLARYDGLVNDDRKIILIAPTWRRNVVNFSVANVKKTHNHNFKDSAYYRIYNQLINDEMLISCAKSHGYRIVYLLHPATSAQKEDFSPNDYVELISGAGDISYERILCESSVMITDYSGVQFDFAYMRKPVIYYHPEELPPQYDEGGLIYDTMGFGPICREHSELVKAVCECVERNCVMEEKHVRRADDFFAYSDRNNCQRIFDAVWEFCENSEKESCPE
ncbi:MAG: CDP-glycerol glycerophosphotransferase family protein [Lachnospiraceae bacterium]|nr:CDP-glycerol glycerophosphotransferase family protein [Lachnospiraceae bacterium]